MLCVLNEKLLHAIVTGLLLNELLSEPYALPWFQLFMSIYLNHLVVAHFWDSPKSRSIKYFGGATTLTV